MKRFLIPFLACSLLAAQEARPAYKTAAPKSATAKKSALDKAALEAYVRHLHLYMPNVQVTIDDPKPAPIPGFVEVAVRASLGTASEERLFYVSKDGQKIVTGSVFDINENPFKPELAKLTTDSVPGLGTMGAPVVLVLFSDFQCQFCREEAKMLRTNLIKAYPTEVRLYFKDYPLEQIHTWAKTAALAGRCVYKQNPPAFWEYHDWIFENQATIAPENSPPGVAAGKIAEFAKSKGWNVDQLNACMASPQTAAEIERSVAEAKSLGVNSTPTFFINGRKIPYSIKWENLKQVIDFEIGYQKTAKNAGEACCEVRLPNPLEPPKSQFPK